MIQSLQVWRINGTYLCICNWVHIRSLQFISNPYSTDFVQSNKLITRPFFESLCVVVEPLKCICNWYNYWNEPTSANWVTVHICSLCVIENCVSNGFFFIKWYNSWVWWKCEHKKRVSWHIVLIKRSYQNFSINFLRSKWSRFAEILILI